MSVFRRTIVPISSGIFNSNEVRRSFWSDSTLDRIELFMLPPKDEKYIYLIPLLYRWIVIRCVIK